MVSVIIPIYNVEKYLRQCVDSVLNQTYTDLEVILVDDGSPDKCGEICDAYAEKDNRVTIIHKENGGLSDARNAGAAVAHGEYIYFLDSDDYIELSAIEKLVSRGTEENADIVFFDAETIYEDHEDSDYKENFKRSQSYPTMRGAQALVKLLSNGEFFSCAPLHLFRRSFLEQQKFCFVKNMMHEDELFTAMAYIRAERVAQVKNTLYAKRLRAKSIMSERKTKKSFDGMVQCIDGFSAEWKIHSEDSKERYALAQCAKTIFNAIVDKYIIFDRNLRKTVNPQVKLMKKLIESADYFSDRKLGIKVVFFRVYVFYKEHLKRW